MFDLTVSELLALAREFANVWGFSVVIGALVIVDLAIWVYRRFTDRD